ncbi:MAG: tRNA uridine-5-carboxymethylaminomethyl(34) synthesis enzyme MnmG [Defluviitaleaceae bacterium]|nr:tRNA uridine-5-carboxymethylaminomethyl(34) synthesis enzyme MnmG [Defluviitaleaceae bacterium]
MHYDIIVIGGGHAGCEAALAAARLGFGEHSSLLHTFEHNSPPHAFKHGSTMYTLGCTVRVLMLAISLDSIAQMPCNPCIGGTSKGHLVREIDALGGAMGKVIDKTYIQSKMLNTAKGPAVHSLRAQADKAKYAAEMRRLLAEQPNLTIRQGEVDEIILDNNGNVSGVKITTGIVYKCNSAVIAAGTYLNARCLIGETVIETGPGGMKRSEALTGSLQKLGLKFIRLKTGTPARIRRSSIDFSKLNIEYGDEPVIPFSFSSTPESIARSQIPCYSTYTTQATHEIIRANIHRSPMHIGLMEGAPTRYCPSIEDKVVRFADKERHQVFIEPEGENTEEMYIQGMSSSLPEDVQEHVYRSIPGLEDCEIMRPAYAIEYSALDATALKLSLEFKDIPNLFSAGQINGSSGYEEAAAQGLIAGINAYRKLAELDPVIIKRNEGYTGVLIDDLVTKGTEEPYRMMTSRAEYRLLLRQDNADIRLLPLAKEIGLVSEKQIATIKDKITAIEAEIKRLDTTIIPPDLFNREIHETHKSSAIQTGMRLSELIKRPELSYKTLSPIDLYRPDLPAAVCEQVEISLKYEGYIKRQERNAEAFLRNEQLALPGDADYKNIHGLRLEARQKLAQHRPSNLGNASRITGVSPSDIAVLLVWLESRRRTHTK